MLTDEQTGAFPIELMQFSEALSNLLIECGFDVVAYEKLYPDLKIFNGEISLISQHLLAHGIYEGRAFQFRWEIDGLIDFLDGINCFPISARTDLIKCAALGWIHYQSPERSSRQEEWSKFDRLARAFEAHGFSAFVIVGDSHSLAYVSTHFVTRRLVPIWALCSGGSARGLNNAASRSGYGAAIKRSLAALSAPLVIHFGQVDVEFVYFFQRGTKEKTQVNLIEIIKFQKDCLDKYGIFLSSLSDLVKGTIFVSGIFPPAMSDEHINTASINAHIAFLNSDRELAELTEDIRQIKFPDIQTRTALHFIMNTRLEEIATRYGFKFLNCFDILIGELGIIDEYFNVAAGTDHHLTLERVSEVLAPRMAEAFSL